MVEYSKNKLKWIIGIILFSIIVLVLGLFTRQYRSLGDTIEDERATYVSEIKNQLVKNIGAEKEQQITLVNIYGQALMNLKPEHFDDIRALLSGEKMGASHDEIFLVDRSGRIYTLEKEERSLSAQDLVYELTEERKAVFGYSQVNQGDEYWIYGAPVSPMTVEGIEICAVINARSVENFGQRMSTSILDNNGFSYIVSKNGNVLVFPSVKNNMGYNLFSTLESYGVAKADIAAMEADFIKGDDGKRIVPFNDNRWLIDYSGDLYDDWVVVVMMPMTITGADTYKMLNTTMALILIFFGSVFVFVMYIIRLFYQRERAREQAIQQEKADLLVAQKIAESKNDFLAKMSHDIRTPLNAIIGLLQITAGQIADRPKAAEHLRQAGKSAEYLLNILNDILDMAKIESGKMTIRQEPFSLQELTDSLWTMNLAQAENKGIDFKVQVVGEPSEYYLGDKGRISQIMMNLLSNAVKFTDTNGHILLRVKVKTKSDQSDTIQFQVEDDGVGMSAEYLERLFQPFEQEEDSQGMNYCGSGLGLSIVKNLSELMNGSVEVESEKGRGSCFTVTLSLIKTEKPEEKADFNEGVKLEGKCVLLVEDNEINSMIAKEILQTNAGMTVRTAWNGQEAVDIIRQSEEWEYDVILMDIRMPVMDGLEATRQIRKLSHPRAANIPIIAMSANAYDEDVASALESGMNDYLAKPVEIQKMIAALKKALGGVQG